MTNTLSCDLLVIGSGPIGSAFARRLADLVPGADIVMVEAGPALTPRPGCHVKNLDNEEKRAIARARSEGPDGRARDADAILTGQNRPIARSGTHLADMRPENAMPAAALSTLSLIHI